MQYERRVVIGRGTSVGPHAVIYYDVEVGSGLVADGAGYDPRRLEREYRLPTLIFHGMRDDAVPWRASLELTERTSSADCRLVLLKDGDHRLTAHKRFIADSSLAWWKELRGESYCCDMKAESSGAYGGGKQRSTRLVLS